MFDSFQKRYLEQETNLSGNDGAMSRTEFICKSILGEIEIMDDQRKVAAKKGATPRRKENYVGDGNTA